MNVLNETQNQNNTLTNFNEQRAELDRYYFMIMHDIKTPISSLISLIRITKEKLPDKSSYSFFEEMEVYLRKLNDDVNLSLRNKALFTQKISEETIDIQTLLKETLNRTIYDREISNVFVNYYVEAIEFKSNRLLINSIFQNIISNAVKHGKTSPSSVLNIDIDVKLIDDILRINIKDDGIGINEEIINNLFGQYEFNTEFNRSNNGLGLNILKKCVEKLKGKLLIERLKKGTGFKIELPITEIKNRPKSK